MSDRSRRRTQVGQVFTQNDLWVQLFLNQIGDVMPRTASTQALRALPATFTYAQARNAGLSRHTLYRLRDGGRVAAISRGLYRKAGSEPADIDLIAIAVKAALGDSVSGHRAGPPRAFRCHPGCPRCRCLAECESLPRMQLSGGTKARPPLSTSAANFWPWTEPSASASTTPHAASSAPSNAGHRRPRAGVRGAAPMAARVGFPTRSVDPPRRPVPQGRNTAADGSGGVVVNRPTRISSDGDAYLDIQKMVKVDGRATDELLALYASRAWRAQLLVEGR